MAENRGRPTVMTPEILAKLSEAFAMGCTDKEACLLADIGLSTLYSYQDEHADFVERKHSLKENPILKARTRIINDLENVETAKWFLERKKKDEFSLRSELTGANGNDLKVNIINYNGDNDTPQLPAQELPTGVPEESSQV